MSSIFNNFLREILCIILYRVIHYDWHHSKTPLGVSQSKSCIEACVFLIHKDNVMWHDNENFWRTKEKSKKNSGKLVRSLKTLENERKIWKIWGRILWKMKNFAKLWEVPEKWKAHWKLIELGQRLHDYLPKYHFILPESWMVHAKSQSKA